MSNLKNIPVDILTKLRALDAEDVAKNLGIEIIKGHKCRCFMHNDSHPSLSFNRRKPNQWHCFVCAKGGNAITLVMEHQVLDFIDACQCLCEMYGIPLQNGKKIYPKARPIKETISTKKAESKPFNKDICKYLIDNLDLSERGRRFLVDERLIDIEIVNQHNIKSIEDGSNIINTLKQKYTDEELLLSGLCTMGKDNTMRLRLWTPCLLFPYYSIDGDLIGIQSRYTGGSYEAPRFQFLAGQKSRVYNLPLLKNLQPEDEIFIAEGITDCLALLSDGKKCLALPSSTILPEEDLKNLRGHRLSMYPDNDEAGLNALDELRGIMMEYKTQVIHRCLPPEFKDYGEYHKAGCPRYDENNLGNSLKGLTLPELYRGIIDWLDKDECDTNDKPRNYYRFRSLFTILMARDLPCIYKEDPEIFGFSNYLSERTGFQYNWTYMSSVWVEYITHVGNFRASVTLALSDIKFVINNLPQEMLECIKFKINGCICIRFLKEGALPFVELDLNNVGSLMKHKKDKSYSLTMLIQNSIVGEFIMEDKNKKKHEENENVSTLLKNINSIISNYRQLLEREISK